VGILIGFVVTVALVLQFTRSVSPFEPPKERQFSTWGSVDAGVALELQSVLDTNVNLIKVPGLQAYIRMPDGKTWSGSSGTTDLARKQPLQRDHVIRVGSVTKSYSAVLIMKLVEEGHLGLYEPVVRWFPGLPSADVITIRHLLNHSSGLPEIIPKVLMKSIIPSTYWEKEKLVELIVEDGPQFTPGSEFAYSNSNYILLGLIAESVSGKPITQLLHEQILDPLNLENTYFIPYEPAPAQLVIGFDRDLASIPGMLTIATGNTSWATSAFTSGAMASTAEDLGIFFERLFSGALLSPSTMEEMTAFIDASNPGFPEQTGSGLGLMQLKVDGRELIGHVGQFMGSTAIAMYSPDEGYTITLTCNLSNADLVRVLVDLQRIIH
jgi:D-alanyl-D-alanine carboxypeptidase